MVRSPTFFVSVYCKIFCDSFSRDMVDRITTGREVYEFLVRDSGNAFSPSGVQIPGDKNIWYLGCNEKAGHLVYNDLPIVWGYGKSSFDLVEEFIRTIHQDGHFTHEQFKHLMSLTIEGRQIDCMYDIPAYLINKRRGRPWKKSQDAIRFREKANEFSKRVITIFENAGYRIQPVA